MPRKTISRKHSHKASPKKVSDKQPMLEETPENELLTLVRARCKLLYVLTYEERRFLEDLYSNVASPNNMQLWVWSTYQGLVKYGEMTRIARATGKYEKSPRADIALDLISEMQIPEKSKGCIYVMRDLHTVLSQGIPRQLRDILYRLRRKTIIITAPELGFSNGPGGSAGLPKILDKDTIVFDYDLMGKGLIREYIERNIAMTLDISKDKSTNSKLKTDYSPGEIDNLVSACQGLTEPELQTAIKTSLTATRKLDPVRILKTKEQLVKKSKILEFVPHTVELSDVGGLDNAKRYFQTYRNSFSPEAKAFSVEPPAGILLTGIPGGGKSLLAKAICQAWGLPGVRLDIGKVMSGLVGSSEANMRTAIKQIEALAPVVVWLDEVEKAMSGVKSSNFSDAGTMSRVFGTFLTWMEEKSSDVVILATANDITQIPPEFIRRFNEVFFVDLPVETERREIFEIHLKKRRRDPAKFDLDKLAEASADYTGAEIEKSIKHAIAVAFMEGRKDVQTEHILTSLQETKPISQVMGEKISKIRAWARGRARYASSVAELLNAPGKQKVKIGQSKEVDLDSSLDLEDVITSDVRAKKNGPVTRPDTNFEDLVVE